MQSTIFLKRQNLFSRILKFLNTCLRGVFGYHLSIRSLGNRVIDRRGFLRIAVSGKIWKFECTRSSSQRIKIHVFVTEVSPRPL